MGAASAVVARADGGRLALLIVNTGANPVLLRAGRPATAAIGIRLVANGGHVSMNYKDDFSLVGKEWNGLATAGTSTLYVQEELIEGGEGLQG